MDETRAALARRCCERKTARGNLYFSLNAAGWAAKRTSANYGGAPLHAYQCPHCNWYHIGRKPRHKRRDRAKKGGA